jgi:hypothetical protein
MSQYSSFSQFCHATSFRPPGRLKGYWRLTKPFLAHPCGLSNMHGLVMATDGILAAIVRSDNQVLTVHKEWLECEEQEREQLSSPEREARVKLSGKAKPSVDIYV